MTERTFEVAWGSCDICDDQAECAIVQSLEPNLDHAFNPDKNARICRRCVERIVAAFPAKEPA